MEPAAELVVHTARRHLAQAVERHRGEIRMAGRAVREREFDRREVVKSRTGPEAEAAVAPVVRGGHRGENLVSQRLGAGVPATLGGGGRGDFRGGLARRFGKAAGVGGVSVGDAAHHVGHPKPARVVSRNVRRHVSRDQNRRAAGSDEAGQRPSARPESIRRLLVVAVDIGTLVAIDLDRDEPAVDERRDLPVRIRGLVHHVAPMTPHRSDIEQDRAFQAPRQFQAPGAPSLPSHRRRRRLAQVETRCAVERPGRQL